MSLQLQNGKTYETRMGDRVRVEKVEDPKNSLYPFEGLETFHRYADNGQYLITRLNKLEPVNNFDLIKLITS